MSDDLKKPMTGSVHGRISELRPSDPIREANRRAAREVFVPVFQPARSDRTMEYMNVLRRVMDEAEFGLEKFGEFRSMPEVYGVLAEEIYEVLLAMHANDKHEFAKELIQVAAVALRGVAEIDTLK